MLLDQLENRKLIHPPKWLTSNTHYLTVMGSIAYGTNLETSDFDVYGFAIPRKEDVFTHLRGDIPGFGQQIQRFEQYIEHGVHDKDAQGGKGRDYDFTVYSIVRYFHLLLENNPNVVDSIYTPSDCVLHITKIGQMVRDNRKIFLHKGIIPKLKGYSYSQLNKAGSHNRTGKRKEEVDEIGWDRKFLMHVVRLCLQAQDVLTIGDIDLRRHKEHLKAVRRGDISLDEVKKWFTEKEAYLDKLYEQSTLPWGPDEAKVKQLLLDILEMHYGSLENCVRVEGKAEQTIREIQQLLERQGY